MCMTLSDTVQLSNTIIYAAEVEKPDAGPVHVIGYQNSVASSGSGPNAMLLPIPTDDLLGPKNVIDATTFPNILKDYEDAVQAMKPKRRSSSLTLGGMMKGVATNSISMTFESGSYTIALANSVDGLQSAVDAVPENRKPKISAEFLTVLAKLYPNWPIAICCFNESEFRNKTMEPIFWWFNSKFPEKLFAPAIDAHDGRPPVDVLVHRDHTLIFGNYAANDIRQSTRALVEKIQQVPEQYRWMFTHAIVGSIVGEPYNPIQNYYKTPFHKNGDFVFPKEKILDSKIPGYIGSDVETESPF